MKKDKKITFCPNCKKPVEACEYFTTQGLSDWRVSGGGLPTIRCSSCGYYGLPIMLPISDYEKITGIKPLKKFKKTKPKK